jgi:cellulose synthase/poly-beta-1,6-N-acetylglucosamine synthase-like glycosyltransferase
VSIALAGFGKKKVELKSGKQHRFAAIIAARNEELVIKNLIDSIKKQNYPSELIDIIVVADNCDDNTADVAESAGAIVYKRFNKAEVGKGYVLKFIYSKLFEERDIYDAFCVFDADNLVDKDFFLHMNNALCSGYEIAQGYRDMKNPADSWISGCHSIFYWMENRFFNQSRRYLGLSASLNGTGFMLSTKLLKNIGFNIKTLTEDLEYTMQSVLAGYTIGWIPEAKVYDEQPITFNQSIRQRVRWTNGFMQCVRYYFFSFVRNLIKKPSWFLFDQFMFALSIPVLFIGVGSTVLYFLLAFLRVFDIANVFTTSALLALGSAVAFWFIGALTLFVEKKRTKGMVKAILAYPIFNLMWIFLYMFSLFKHRIEWKPIVHVRNISLNEIDGSDNS